MSGRRIARLVVGVVTALGVSMLPSCGCDSAPEMKEVAPVTPVLKVAGRDIVVELATDEPARNRGLMYRPHLADDRGMLFVFPTDNMLHFYMRNTLIPLDIIFLQADGTVINVTHGTPGVEEPTCNSARPARLVLELNGGWCAANGLKAGDRIVVAPEILSRGR